MPLSEAMTTTKGTTLTLPFKLLVVLIRHSFLILIIILQKISLSNIIFLKESNKLGLSLKCILISTNRNTHKMNIFLQSLWKYPKNLRNNFHLPSTSLPITFLIARAPLSTLLTANVLIPSFLNIIPLSPWVQTQLNNSIKQYLNHYFFLNYEHFSPRKLNNSSK